MNDKQNSKSSKDRREEDQTIDTFAASALNALIIRSRGKTIPFGQIALESFQAAEEMMIAREHFRKKREEQ